MDIDKVPQMAHMLKITLLPTTLLISGGNVIDGMSGVPTNSEFGAFFASLGKILELHDSGEREKELIEEVRELVKERKSFSLANIVEDGEI